jgi:hypothetical protein
MHSALSLSAERETFGDVGDASGFPSAFLRRSRVVSLGHTAEFYVPGCKDFSSGQSNFLGGRCMGVIEVLDALGHDTKAFCAAEASNSPERVRIIVTNIEARPERMKEDFRPLPNEVMAQAWPCKN